MDVDDFLAHYGTKGMKWGVTRANAKGTSQRSQKIQSARNRQESNAANVAKAKSDFKSAKKTFNTDKAIAGMSKNGKEFAVDLLFGSSVKRKAMAAPGNRSQQSDRANKIDAARSRISDSKKRVLDAKASLKEMKAKQDSDSAVAAQFKSGKEFAAWFAGGELGQRAYSRKAAASS